VGEGQTWSSEDTRVFSFKVLFWPRLAASICVTSLPTAVAVYSEAQRIVFAAEGLLLARGFPVNGGIGLNFNFQVFKSQLMNAAVR
jgi:hypothetical protein